VLNIQAKEYYLMFLFCLLLIASGADLLTDLAEGANFNHIAQETVVFSLSFIALGWLLLDIRNQRIQLSALRDELATITKSDKKSDSYVTEAKSTLSHVISRQFDDWQLTASEKDVGWLLLKGLSLKEIAALRETLEKTVRSQASSIYKKSELSGRHAFAAWFIEDAL